jgi:HlyD family secretion protein
LTQAQGQLSYAQSLLDATVIRAPVNGTILERTAEKGELITAQFASAADTGGPQGSVVALADLNDLQVELDIAQNDFARLQPHQPATLSTDAYPDRVYHGYIDQISPEADRQKATVQVKVKILNPDSYLRPEMNANVKFLAVRDQAAPPPKGVLVPLDAIHVRDGKSYVYVLQKDHAVEREVHFTAQRAAGSLTEDLPSGAQVIVKSAAPLKSGDHVKVGTVAGA